MKQKRYMKNYYKNILISIMTILFSVNCISCTNKSNSVEISGSNNKIVIDIRKDIGNINKKLLGNNFVGYDPVPVGFSYTEYYGYSDYGAGIWNPGEDKSIKEVVGLAKEAGITIARFPGGCGTHHYNWKAAVGKKRRYFLYGIDEFLKTCSEIKAEPVMTVRDMDVTISTI